MNPLEEKLSTQNFNEQARKVLTKETNNKSRSRSRPKPKPVRFAFKKGMDIHFYGEHYRVTLVKTRGRVTLKHLGRWKGKVPE